MMSIGKPGSQSSTESMMTAMKDPTATRNGKNESLGKVLNKMTTGSELGEATTTKVKNNDELNKEDFMALLVAELQNQNPLEPMDNQEFGSHLAQFSQLEQLEAVNKNLSSMSRSDEPVMS